MISFDALDLILKGILVLGVVGVVLALLIGAVFALMNRAATTNRGMRHRH